MLKILQTRSARQVGFLLLMASVFIAPSSAAPPALKTLHNFTGTSDGAFPEAGLVLGSGGALYGTTSGGAFGWGGVFELLPSKTGTWSDVTLYSFTGGADGAIPTSDLIIGPSNVLYGTTSYGGTWGYGTVFQLSPGAGGAWTEKVLYSFKGGADGANPAAGLVLASSTGVLYGTTYNGGAAGFGTVFQLGPAAPGVWTEKILYSFIGGNDGANPLADLVIGPGTTLYGATEQGGTVTSQTGCTTPPCTFTNWGVVFQVAPKGGGNWAESVLYTFSGGADGGTPESALILGANNVLYGNTFWGGSPAVCPVGGYPQGCGVVYSLVPPTGGGAWTENVLHTFTGVSPDGAHPYRNMAINTSGTLFGTTYAGGLPNNFCFPASYSGCGTIFSLKPPAAPGGTWTKSNITTFNGTTGGAPNGVILGTSATLYGTTVMGGSSNGSGTVFSMAIGTTK